MKTDIKVARLAPKKPNGLGIGGMLMSPGVYKVLGGDTVRVISFGDGKTALYVSGPTVCSLNQTLWKADSFELVDEEISITFSNED